jgi:hypothetical protein
LTRAEKVRQGFVKGGRSSASLPNDYGHRVAWIIVFNVQIMPH